MPGAGVGPRELRARHQGQGRGRPFSRQDAAGEHSHRCPKTGGFTANRADLGLGPGPHLDN